MQNEALSPSDPKARLEALRQLLRQGTLSSQDELREKLEKLRFRTTQSTVSRDLRKLGAVKATDSDGRTVYRLPDEELQPVTSSRLSNLVQDIRANGFMIVIKTSPGSASLVARHLDRTRPSEILGTIAGDDTIFVAPSNPQSILTTVRAIESAIQSLD